MGTTHLRRPGHLYKRGPIWWCWFYDLAGKRHRVSTRCTDQRAAEQVLRSLERDAAAGERRVQPHTVLEALTHLVEHGLGDLAEASQAYYAQKTLSLGRLLGELDVNALSLDDVQGYIDTRRVEKNEHLKRAVTSHTIAKELVTLRKALRLARDRGFLKLEPAGLIPRWRPKYRPRERHLSHAEYLKLRAILPEECGRVEGKRVTVGRERRQLWLEVACFTGLRDKELLELEWSWFDLKEGWLHVRGTKTDEADRHIPLHGPLLASLRARKGVGRVFPAWPSRRRDLGRACDTAGIDRVTPNDLRRTFASWLKQRGVDSAVVAQLLGHTTSAMVERVYGHLTNETLAAAIAKLPGRKSLSHLRHSR